MNTPRLLFKLRVLSRSEVNTFRTVEVYDNGMMLCDCPANPNILCRHKETILKTLEKIVATMRTKHPILSINDHPLAENPPVGNPPVGNVPHKKVVSSKKVNTYKEDDLLNNLKRYETMTAGLLGKVAITDQREFAEAQEDMAAELRPSGQKSWQERNEENRAFKAEQEAWRNQNI